MHVDQGEAAVRDGGLENGHELFLVAGETARDEGGSDAQAEHHRIDGRHGVGLALLALGADVGGGGELALGEPVHAVVLDDVEHAHIAADGVAHVAEADGERVAIARDADVERGSRLAALAPVAMGGMRPCAELKPCAPLTK